MGLQLKRNEARYAVTDADEDKNDIVGREERELGLQPTLKAYMLDETVVEEQREPQQLTPSELELSPW